MPAYAQLVDQVRGALRLGLLQRGDQLPTVKEVAGTLAINPNTVLRAYRDLEHLGVVSSRPGAGTFVVAEPGGVTVEARERLTKKLMQWLDEADREGMDVEAVLALFRMALESRRSAA